MTMDPILLKQLKLRGDLAGFGGWVSQSDCEELIKRGWTCIEDSCYSQTYKYEPNPLASPEHPSFYLALSIRCNFRYSEEDLPSSYIYDRVILRSNFDRHMQFHFPRDSLSIRELFKARAEKDEPIAKYFFQTFLYHQDANAILEEIDAINNLVCKLQAAAFAVDGDNIPST